MTESLVCVVGSVNLDTTYVVRQLPASGETILATTSQLSHGGKGANQSAAVAILGGTVALVAAVGDDDPGRSAVGELAACGVDVDAVVVERRASTGSAVILVAADGENVIVVDPGANGLLEASSTAEHVRRLGPAVLLGQLEVPVDALVAAAQAAPDTLFVLNPAPMPADRSLVVPLLNLVNVLVPNRTELAQLVGLPEPSTPQDVDRCAAALGFAGTLVVTLGADGAMVYEGSRRQAHVPAAEVDVVDTSGAGDAFCGALAHHLARGDSMEDAIVRATELAGRSTTHRGARIPAPVEPR